MLLRMIGRVEIGIGIGRRVSWWGEVLTVHTYIHGLRTYVHTYIHTGVHERGAMQGVVEFPGWAQW